VLPVQIIPDICGLKKTRGLKMNVFILNTGRCGSHTFVKACQHISNFSSAHESRAKLIGEERFNYPDMHIEADNRLSWLLGRLDKQYGNNALYVHLKRNTNDTAESFVKRYHFGIISAYRKGILKGLQDETASALSVSLDYCHTVNSNIGLFLKDKTNKIGFDLENARQDFKRFWDFVGAEGDIDAALLEFSTYYNASKPPPNNNKKTLPLPMRVLRKMGRLIVKLPDFVENA